MRSINHPSVEDITVEGVLHALSDPTRARILAQLIQSQCAQNCASFIRIKGKPLAKSTLSQHFRVLREAGLIRSEREGVHLRNTPRCNELRAHFGTLIETILKSYTSQESATKRRRG